MSISSNEKKDDNQPIESQEELNSLFLEALKELTSHPLKMQLLFYLISFGEQSLTSLSRLLGKPKTTVHHHTRSLEEKGILLVRKEKVKNYVENYYRLNDQILRAIAQQQALQKAVDKGEISKENIASMFKAFSAFTYAILERFSTYFLKSFDPSKDALEKATFQLSITTYEKYWKIIKKIKEFAAELDQEDKVQEIKAPKDSWALIVIGVPYSKMFEDVLSKEKDEKPP